MYACPMLKSELILTGVEISALIATKLLDHPTVVETSEGEMTDRNDKTLAK